MTHYWKKTDTQIIYWKGWIIEDLTTIERLGIVGEGENYQETEFSTKEEAEYYLASQIEKLKADNFKVCSMEDLDVLFVQLYSAGLNIPKEHNPPFNKLLDLRHEIESSIDDELKENGLGEWFAGDLGQGGANMLFYVYQLESAFETILEVLEDNQLLDKTLITQRVNATADDWNYEVIYPADYDGVFYSV